MVRDSRSRPVRIGAVAAHDNDAVVVDEVLPIAVVVSGAGEVLGVHTWELLADWRGRPTAADVALTEREVLIATPAAGGLVRIDRQTGATTTVALDAAPAHIVVIGDDIWGIGGWFPDVPDCDSDIWHSGRFVSHPVVRDDGGLRAGGMPTEAAQRDLTDEVSDEETRRVWRVRGTQADAVEFNGTVSSIGGWRHVVVAVSRMADDPVIAGPKGLWSESSASLLLAKGDDPFVVIAELPSHPQVISTHDGVVLLAADETLCFVDLDHRRLGDPLLVRRTWPDRLAFLDNDRLATLRAPHYRGPAVLNVATVDGLESRSVAVPGKTELDLAVSPSLIWCWRTSPSQLFVIDPTSLAVREVPVTIDTAPYAPEIVTPAIDRAANDQAQLARVRSTFFAWPVEQVAFESIELFDEFPYTEIVAMFSIDYALSDGSVAVFVSTTISATFSTSGTSGSTSARRSARALLARRMRATTASSGSEEQVDFAPERRRLTSRLLYQTPPRVSRALTGRGASSGESAGVAAGASVHPSRATEFAEAVGVDGRIDGQRCRDAGNALATPRRRLSWRLEWMKGKRAESARLPLRAALGGDDTFRAHRGSEQYG